MKLIKSDKNGRNIHSPFVYRLVANVLFAPYPFYAFSEINQLIKKREELFQIQSIFRLVNHFQFAEVSIFGDQDKIFETVCKLAKSEIKINTASTKDQNLKKGEYLKLVIFNDYKSISIAKYPQNPEVWICTNMFEKESIKQFTTLCLNQEVHITINLKRFGIAIFNKNFEKQNYVIKH